jgi:DNA replication protein DnaC
MSNPANLGILKSLFGYPIQPDSGYCDHHKKEYSSFRIMINGEWIGGCPDCALAAAEVLRHEEQLVIAREARLASAAQRISRSEIPSQFLRCTLDNYEVEGNPNRRVALDAARNFVKAWGEHPQNWLLFMGNFGNGKTHLACAAAMEIARIYKQGNILYLPAYNLAPKIRSSFGSDTESEYSIKRSIAQFDGLLVMDDIGWQHGTDYDRQVTSEIIAERYSHGKSLIMMTNMDEDQMAAFLGYQTFDRIAERSDAVAFSWDSYRSKTKLAFR